MSGAAMPALHRHDLVMVEERGWSGLLQREPGLGDLDGVRLWIARGWPAMVRRRQPGDASGLVPLALALPPALGRLRLPIQLPAELITPSAPITLEDVLDRAVLPRSWRLRIGQVRDATAGLGLSPILFGSLLWQHVTGLPYLRDTSDLDLCWRLPADNAAGIEALLATLLRLDGLPGPRLDGEIEIAGLGAVSWRELAGGRDDLLAKTDDAVRMVPRSCFLAPEGAPC